MLNRAVIVAVWAGLLVACEPGVFRTEVKGQTTVEGSPILGELLGTFPQVGSFTNLDFDQNQDFRNQGVTKDQVKSVKVEGIELRIVSPDDQDFSFLETLEFVARAGDNEAVIASKANIASLNLRAPNPVLKLDVRNVELQPFVTAPSMSINVRGSGRQPPQDSKLEAAVDLRVEINLL